MSFLSPQRVHHIYKIVTRKDLQNSNHEEFELHKGRKSEEKSNEMGVMESLDLDD